MFNPAKMSKVRTICMKKDQPAVISELHEQGLLHIKTFESESLRKDAPLQLLPQIVHQLVRLESMLRLMQPQEKISQQKVKHIEEILKECEQLQFDRQLSDIQQQLEQLAAEEERLLSDKSSLSLFKTFNLDFSRLKSEIVAILSGTIPTQNLPFFRDHLRQQKVHFELLHRSYTKDTSVAILAVLRSDLVSAKEILPKHGFVEAQLPSLSGRPPEISQKIEASLSEIGSKRQKLKKSLAEISGKNFSKLQYLHECLLIEKQRCEIPSKFAASQEIFVIEGWIPKANIRALQNSLSKATSNKFLMEELHLNHHELEEAPTLLKNPSTLSPFEFLVEFINLPKSSELDPTFILALFFPIFYGLMLGDVGYGFASLLLALLIIAKTKPDNLLNPVAKVWALCALPAIVFGIIFDEYFGFTHNKLLTMLGHPTMPLYHGIERMHSIEILFPIVILVGVATVAAGFFFGFINGLKEQNFKHAFAKLGWFALTISGTFAVSAAMFHLFDQTVLTISAIVFVGSLIPIIKAEGPIALIEIPSVAGNILSFARLLAVGIAGVVFALIINEQLLPKPEQGLWLLLTVPLFLLGHLFNTILCMFESLIQGARLNFVELFSKFFVGGGEKFAPFKAERKFTLR